MNTGKLIQRNFFQQFKLTIQIRNAFITGVFLLILYTPSFSQNVGISATGEPSDNSAGLDINFANKGLLIPRINLTSTTDVATIPAPAVSLLVYNTNAGMTGGSIGYWYWNGVTWIKLTDGTALTGWSTVGNSGTSSGSNFLGTTDNKGLSLRTNNTEAIHIDSLQRVSIGVKNTDKKFEVNGPFRLRKDSFNILQTDDLFPSSLPNIRYVGATYRIPSLTGAFVNGIAHTPIILGDDPSAVAGYIDFSTGIQNVFSAGRANISIYSATATSSSSMNFENNGSMNLSTQRGSDTSANISFGSNGINIYHGNNNIGNTNMNFNDSSFYINVNENVGNNRSSSVQINPSDYNIYNSDNAGNNYSGLNFNSLRSNLYFNSPVGNTHLELTDSSNDQYVSENTTNRNTGIVTKADNYNIYNSDNANNNYSGVNFNSQGYNLYVNSPSYNSNFHITDSSAYFTSNQQSKFGIGTTDPTNALHVFAFSDPVRFEGLQSGSPTDNVITVDANGVLHTSVSMGSGWSLTGNAGTTSATNFIGTTDGQDLRFIVNNTPAGRLTVDGQAFFGRNAGLNTTGGNNAALGENSLYTNTTGINNTAVGTSALYSNTTANANTALGDQALYSNTTGYYNTATGANSLYSNTTGFYNTASGLNSLFSNTEGTSNSATGTGTLFNNTTGSGNTAMGGNSLYSNTTGGNNTATGVGALYNNTTANFNTASGSNALYSNTTGQNNTATGNGSLQNNTEGNSNSAVGSNAMVSNTSGNQNTAIGQNSSFTNTTGSANTAAGYQTFYFNETGSQNTALGYRALFSNTTADYNTSTGHSSLYYNTTGSDNTASGHQALFFNNTGDNNTALGHAALFSNKTGNNNTAIGYGADIGADNLNNATAIGHNAIAGSSNTLVLGGTGADQVSVGVGTTTPNSYLETAGSFGTAITTITSNITLNSTHYTVIVTGGAPVITLPAPGAGNNRRSYRIINQNSLPVVISPYIDFNGGPGLTVPGNSKIEVQSDGNDWYRVD